MPPPPLLPQRPGLPTPELSQLRAFVAVADLRNYRRAAVCLNVSPSAVSQSVRTLETMLGLALLNRTTRTVAITEAGAELHARLRVHLAGLDDALTQAAGQGQDVAGTLRLNMPRSAALLIIEPLMAPFLRAHPQVHLELCTQDGFVDIVAAGCDAGIRFSEAVPQDMVALPLGPPQRFIVAGAPALLQRHGAPADPWALLSQPCVRLRFPSGAIYRWEFACDGQQQALDVSGPLTVDDQHLALRAARDGLGWAYVYEAMAQEDLAAGRLVAVLDDWCPAGTGFQLYYPGRRQASPALQALVKWMLPQLGGQRLPAAVA